MTLKPIFAFDFSMNKPAMSALINGKLSFYVWASDIDNKAYEILKDCGINVVNRNLPKMKDGEFNEHTLILEHIKRSTDLAKMILETIKEILEKESPETSYEDVIISNEGFAFSAKGDAALDLSGYKYILMYTLINAGFKNFRTFSPITLKKTAGCSKKGLGKDAMINALANEEKGTHPLIDIIRENPEFLKKKTAFVMCTDDIADSYWCLKTTIDKEK